MAGSDRAASVHFTSPSGRLPALDGVRGLAILLVMTSHLYGLVFAIEGRAPTLGIDLWVKRVTGIGWVGVDLFFVLSGFLITGILYDAKNSNSYFRSFYARRFLRIFPLYYGFLIFLLLVAPHFDTLARASNVDALREGQFWYWTYLSNYSSSIEQISTEQTFQTGFRHFWSLAIEEQFYVIWPAFVLLLDRRKLMIACVALVVIAFLTRVYLSSEAASSWARLNASHAFLPARMDTLALGALLALAARDGDLLQRFAKYAPAVIAATGALLFVFFLRDEGLSTLVRHMQTYGFAAVAILFAALLALVVTSKPESLLHRAFAHPWLMFFGQYAYALYVVHLLVGHVLADRFAREYDIPTVLDSQIPVSIAFALLATSVSVAIAWTSWHLFEKQILKLKRYFPYEDRDAAAPAPRRVPPGDSELAARAP